MVDQNSSGAGPYTGYLRRYTYQVNGHTRTCTGTDTFVPATGGLETSGDGFIQNHTSDGGDYSTGNGPGTPGTTAITLQGASHAIITYSIPGYPIGAATVPSAVSWFFADGRSHPVFSVAHDARATAGNLGADSRTPYGDMAYDGDGIDALVGGFSYGDTFKFVTTASGPEQVTNASGWRATESNDIPYVMQWTDPAAVDAEMGHVATLPIKAATRTRAILLTRPIFLIRALSRSPAVLCRPRRRLLIRPSSTAFPPPVPPTAKDSRGERALGGSADSTITATRPLTRNSTPAIRMTQSISRWPARAPMGC